jgi:hypothetical protein
MLDPGISSSLVLYLRGMLGTRGNNVGNPNKVFGNRSLLLTRWRYQSQVKVVAFLKQI